MSKVSGTYPSLSRGVSQQPFEARLDGQHGEQVNMWSDPVHGLSRRRGTVLQYCSISNMLGPSYHQLTTEDLKREYREWIASFRTITYTVDGKEFMIHYPSGPKPSWITSVFTGPDLGVKASRKFDRAGSTEAYATVVDVGKGTYGNTEYTRTWDACAKGFSGAVQVGRHVLLYPNATAHPAPQQIDSWAALTNGSVALEVKQGIPNRTYRVQVTIGGMQQYFTYTTPSSAYSGTLDTSDIPFGDQEYQKKVNDRVNAYNDAVTKWITTAANQTRPQVIAQQLALQMDTNMQAAGALVNYNAVNPYIIVYIPNGHVANFVTTDGGDGSNFIVNERTVDSISKLTNYHIAGKIMQIKPGRGEQAFYMRAVSDNLYAFGRIRWEECPRTTAAAAAAPWLILSHNPANGKLGVAMGDPSGLLYLTQNILGFGANDPLRPDELPQPNHRLVGDADTSPTPAFYGKQITWVGMFQDRLAFASGGTLNFSEVGNYFNFWRTQTLTVPDKDSVEVYALGSETDIIRHSVIFDRSLLLFGDNQQYSIDGRNPLTPSTSTIIQSSAIEGTTDAPPVVGRDLVFFSKRREASTEVFQMEVGDVSDTSRFTGLGLQLSDYLPGKPAQMLYVSSPSTLFVRTSESPHSIYVFKFIDQGNQRIMDSWSRFAYHPAFGLILGMFYHDDAIYLRIDREAWVDKAGRTWAGGRGDLGFEVLERQSLLPQVPGLAYLDSARKGHTLWTASEYGTDWLNDEYPFLAAAFSRDKLDNVTAGIQPPPKNKYWLHGHMPAPHTLALFNTVFADIPEGDAKRDTNYYTLGIPFESYVELTSPVRRDQNGQPIMQGRLTVNKLDVYYKDAGGFEATVTSRYGNETALRFNGRVLGDSLNMVGVNPVATGNTPVFVGRESKDYVCKIGSRSWMPLSITRITWTGQWFMNHRFI